jgi:hypothetical protein
MTDADDHAPAHRSRWRRFSPSMGWKAFWSEILIVVLGVAIALAANEAVEDLSWRGKVRDGEARVRGDTERVFMWGAENYATQPCFEAQLDRLAQRVMESGTTLTPAPVYSDSTSPLPVNPRFVLRMPTRPWRFPVWEALVANGTATHFSRQRQDIYSSLDYSIAAASGYRDESIRLYGRLMALSYPAELDAAARREYLVDIETLRRMNLSILITARQQMSLMLRDGMAPTPESVDAFITANTGTVKFCQEQGLPLADWREVKPAPPSQ